LGYIKKCFIKKSLEVIFFLCFYLIGCNQDRIPFSYRYTSPKEVIIDYQGKQYTLKPNTKLNTAFEYSFEPDGDLDIVINGIEYEIDSPFDIDNKKKKKTKKTTVKTKK